MRYLTFALTKGRLADKTLALLEKTGITCEEMKDKDSRKLIFVNEELKMRFFLAKGPDIVYAIVQHAALTGNMDYIAKYGLEVMIAVSRFWRQRVSFSQPKQKYVILGVTGPDQYENNVDNNSYTN